MPQPAATVPVPGLLAGLVRDPGRPRLTWYGPGGERIELSGHVLDNWVTKTTNLLLEEYQVGPGSRVLVDLPVHWRTVVWALAVWRTGACTVLDEGAPPAPGGSPATCGNPATGGNPARPGVPDVAAVDVVVTSRPEAYADVAGVEVVAVALPALARSFAGPLDGAVDAAAAVMTYGDVLTWVPEPDAAAPAVEVADEVVPHGRLLDWVADRWRAAGPTADAGALSASVEPARAAGARVLLEPGDTAAPASVLAATLSVYATDGSVVLCAPSVVAELSADPLRRARLVEGERVSTR